MSSAAPALPHELGFRPPDLVATLARTGLTLRDEDARRILAWRISHGREGFPERIGKRVQAAYLDAIDRRRLRIVEEVTDPGDGFTKFLFEHGDGSVTEAVRIPLLKQGCHSICLSSQVGCAMGCQFCATGRLGWKRHLAAWEMVAQWVAVRDRTQGRVTGAVFQGQGEPFHNYDEVIQAARVLCDPCGGRISGEAISISTVGLIPAIRRYTEEGHPFRLIVSLTSAVAERRRELLPVSGRQDLGELAQAIREHARSRKGLITVAWVLLGGINHDDREVEALRELLGDVPLRVNLIDVNDARDGGFRAASDPERKAFMNALQVLRAPIVRRYSGGSSRHAACGMLAATRWGEVPLPPPSVSDIEDP
jgi:23S rRNA (adenine2503-C2)-methyltransferase